MAAKLIAIGKNVTFSIAPITINSSSGAITVGTAVALTGTAKRANKRLMRELERIQALDAAIANNVYLFDNWEIVLASIKLSAGTNPEILQADFMAGPYAQIVITLPSTKVFTYQGILSALNINIDGPGQMLDEITLVPFDNGGSNPSYA